MIVWVNGTFDILHKGHLQLLEFASSFGELIVGVDTDKRVKELKGDDRPFNSCQDRMYFLSRIIGVNRVVSFDSDFELSEQIRLLSPDLMVIGSDYKDKKIIGSEYIKKVIFFEKIEGYSTTKILEK